MKKLLNRLIQSLIGISQNSANRTDPPDNGNSIFILTVVALALCCSALSPSALAGPSPKTVGEDRGKNNSAAEGIVSLNINTTGQNNTAHGWYSLSANTDGSDNTANGFKTLSSNTTGRFNTATGSQALISNTSGSWNNAFGGEALFSIVTGDFNNAVGGAALYSNTTGSENTAVGDLALSSNTTGSGNVAIGAQALASSTVAGYNATGEQASVAIGYRALTNAIGSGWYSGDGNTAVGDRALESDTDGHDNNAFGLRAMNSNTGGAYNTAVGSWALGGNSTGAFNVAIGNSALGYNTADNSNVGIGFDALGLKRYGGDNTAVGDHAGVQLDTGSGNVYIGAGVAGPAYPYREDNHTYIRNINTTSVSGGNTDTVTVNLTTGLIGHLSSSRRYKESIQPMDNASETLYRLKPVTYRYKKEIDQGQSLDYGLIAEEVAEVDPNLALRNGEGQIESVRYNAINLMLLNEFLKEHKTVEEQQATIRQLKSEAADQKLTISAFKKEMGVLIAQVKEQAAQIQKVSVQIETSRNAARLVANH